MATSIRDIFISRHELEKLTREHINLKNGQRLEGHVVEIRNDGKVVLDFETFKSIVELKAPVEKGDVVTMVVLDETGKGKTIKLKLADIQIYPKKENTAEATKAMLQIETIQATKELKQQIQTRSFIEQRLHNEITSPVNSVNKEKFFDRVELTEDTGALFENIKMSIKQIHYNTKSGQTFLEILPEIKNIFANVSQISTAIKDTLKVYPDDLPGEVQQGLNMLRFHFEPLDIGENALKLVPKLKSLVQDSGIFFEKKIENLIERLADVSANIGRRNLGQLPETREIIEHDLKPHLLMLQEYFDRNKLISHLNPLDNFEAIKKSIEELLTHINNQQWRAVEAGDQRQPFQVFYFQIPLKEGAEAQLKVFYQKKRKKREENEFKLSLLLNMDKLGEIRTDFSRGRKKLNITFFVKNNEVKEFLENHLGDIEEVLRPNFKSLYLKVFFSPEKIAAFSTEFLEPGIITNKSIDIKV